MAEAAGLVIGGIALIALFDDSIKFLECIDSGRHYSKEYEQALTMMLVLRARLAAWGESVNVSQPGQELPALRNGWSKYQEPVARSLVGIKSLFNNSKTLEQKYGLKQSSMDPGAPPLVATPSHSGSFEELEHSLATTIALRQRDTSFRKKFIWAIKDKKKFDALIAEVSAYIDGLEGISSSLNILSTQQEMFRNSVQQVRSAESIILLAGAVSELARASASAPTHGSQGFGDTIGHQYISTIVSDRANVLNGDVGNVEGRSQHRYENTQVYGDARVVQGNMSGDAFAAFMR
jgi:Prion-inhibition and propagation